MARSGHVHVLDTGTKARYCQAVVKDWLTHGAKHFLPKITAGKRLTVKNWLPGWSITPAHATTCTLFGTHRARRPMTSQRKSRKCCRNCFSVSVCGVPPTSATMLQGKRPCSAVCLYRLFSTTCARHARVLWLPGVSGQPRASKPQQGRFPYSALYVFRLSSTCRMQRALTSVAQHCLHAGPMGTARLAGTHRQQQRKRALLEALL